MGPKKTRAELSKDAVLDAALALAERDGLEFSMRDLGDALSSWANTIYAFYPTKHDLQNAMLDRIVAQALTDSVVEHFLDSDLPWQSRLRAFGMAIFDTHSRYPGAGHLITHFGMVGSPNGIRLFQLMMHFFMSIGLTPERSAVVLQTSAFFLLEISDLAARKARGLANSKAMTDSPLASTAEDEIALAVRTMIDIPIRDRALAGIDLMITALDVELTTS